MSRSFIIFLGFAVLSVCRGSALNEVTPLVPAPAAGGTCFGDSGGPNYLGTSNVIAGVTSFGLNGTCGGTGGVFRLDRKNVLDFVTPFLK